MPVAIVIVTYNSAGYLAACLESLRDSGARVIVVDNGSADASVAVARQLGATVIANAQNRGLAAAANQGAQAAPEAGFLLFLNPDAALLGGFEELVQTLREDPAAGAAAGLLLDHTGQPQAGFTVRSLPSFTALAFEVLLVNRLWPGNPVNRRYRCLDLPLDRRAVVEQPAGACLLLRREALEKAGGWDERFYPLWFEDVDLCLRLRRAAYRILFCPASRWRHAGGHSLASISFTQKELFWYRSLLRYVRKHMGIAAALAMRGIICAGATARLISSLFVPGGERSWSAYWAVVKSALMGKAYPSPPDTVK